MIEENAMQIRLNVLSLEDSDLDFEIISEHLIKAGYILDISRAEKEADFLSLIQSKTFDIILADFKLPQFDAFEALNLCNRHYPDVPFICVSGSIGEITAIELLKKGAVDYVIKDRLERLPFAIKRALEEKKEKNALKLAEEELKKKEENFRTLTENIPDIIARFDKNLKHIYINPAIEKITGMPPGSFLGKTNEELGMPVEKVAFWNKNIRYVFQTGKQLTYEFEFQTPTTTFHFSSMLVPEFDEDGKVNTILSVTRDISENKKAEIALRKSEERLRDILFSTADWVWEVDQNGKYAYSSQKGIDFFELSQEEIIGKTPFDFMPEDEAKRVSPIFNGIVAKKEPIKDLENWNVGKDGKKICLLTNGVPILDNEGQLIGYRGVDKDITERKLAEQELIKAKERAEASDRLKTAFMNNISHEIRTPLNGILGFGQIIADPSFPDMGKEGYFSMLNESCDRLLNTVTNIMDISLLASGNQKLKKKEVALSQLFGRIKEKFTISCQQKKLSISLPEKTKQTLYTDEDLLTKIFHQLIDNAVKFTSQGKITVGFEKYKNEYHFFVKDTGIGISEEYKSRIFGNFEQEDFATTRKYEGTGIGLAIAKGLIELLAGKMWLESEKGKGSTFYFSIPIE
jgi:PAS domain S-box-containing protein